MGPIVVSLGIHPKIMQSLTNVEAPMMDSLIITISYLTWTNYY